MQLFDLIAGPNGRNLDRLAKNLDLSPDQSSAVIQSVLPEFRHFLERKTLSRGGLADIIQTLGNERQSRYLDANADLTTPDATETGNEVLGTVLETKYRSRALADKAERETGVPAEKIRQMLPRIANVSMGALAEQTRPALEDVFKKLPGFSKETSGGGFRPSSSGSPLPLPDDNWGGGSQTRSGYDDLSDILKRRQGPAQSNPLWDIVRQILGSSAGFQSKGIIGYIIRFFLYRYGWSILRMILGRVFRI